MPNMLDMLMETIGDYNQQVDIAKIIKQMMLSSEATRMEEYGDPEYDSMLQAINREQRVNVSDQRPWNSPPWTPTEQDVIDSLAGKPPLFFGAGDIPRPDEYLGDKTETPVRGSFDIPKTFEESIDYETDPRFTDFDKGIAVGKISPEKLALIRKQAAEKFPGATGGGYMEVGGNIQYEGEDIDKYNERTFDELDKTWAKRRLRELQARGGVSGRPQDLAEAQGLMQFIGQQQYADAIAGKNQSYVDAARLKAKADEKLAGQEANKEFLDDTFDRVEKQFASAVELAKMNDDEEMFKKILSIRGKFVRDPRAAMQVMQELEDLMGTGGGAAEAEMMMGFDSEPAGI